MTLKEIMCGICCMCVMSAQVAAQSSANTENGSAFQVFTNARVIVGDGRVLEQAAIVVRAGVLIDVGLMSTITVPENAYSHDLTGKTVMPALVNTHAHLGWEAYGDWGSQYFTEDNLIDHLYRHAYYGVGTIISTGSDREDIAQRVKLEQLRGNIAGARYFLSPGMGSPGGGPNPRFTDDPGYWGVHAIATAEQASETVAALAGRGATIAKIWVDNRDENRGAQVKLAPEIYQSVLQAAARHDMRIIAHATTLADHKSLITLGNRRFIHMPYDADVDSEYLQMVRDNNVYIVPTLGMVTKSEPYYVPAFADTFFHDQVPPSVLAELGRNYNGAMTNSSAERSEAAQQRSNRMANNLLKLKDHIILGTDAGAVGDYFGFADHVELALFVRMGMTPAEAIIAATSRSANAFGLHNVGLLEAGKAADFVILDENPLDNINNTRLISDVYLRGERVDREGLREKWIQEN